MGKFKKWIVKLFSITQDDIERSTEVNLQPAIRKEIQDTLEQVLPKILEKEIRRTIEEQLQSLISRTVFGLTMPATKEAEDTSLPERLSEMLTPATAIGEFSEPMVSTTPSELPEPGSLDQAFPVIDEPVLKLVQEKNFNEPEILREEEWKPIESDPRELEPAEATLPEQKFLPIHEKIRIGIDFGTTTTSVSLRFGDELPIVVPIGRETPEYIPSVFYLAPGSGSVDQRVVVGEAAEGYTSPYIIRSAKRCLGCRDITCKGKNGSSHPVCQGSGNIQVGETETLPAIRVAYFIVREALNRTIYWVQEEKGLNLRQENIGFLPLNMGCGARFSLDQRNLMVEMADELGFKQFSIENVVEEPILAGFAYARFANAPEGRILVYDFGGGTFDVAVLQIGRTSDNQQRVTVLATAGEQWLGGDDIDRLIYQHFLKLIPGGSDINLDLVAQGQLRMRARRAKELLSTSQEFVDAIFIPGLEPINLNCSRRELEHLIEQSGLVKKSLDATLEACQLAYAIDVARGKDLLNTQQVLQHTLKDSAQHIDRVMLVGGVTKMPYVRRKLEELYGSEKIVGETVIDPLVAVAVGGAYPREPQHYSIAFPPYQFQLRGEVPGHLEASKDERIVLEAYQEYTYFGNWINNASPSHRERILLPQEYEKSNLYFRRVSALEWVLLKSIGYMRPGTWYLDVELSGKMRCVCQNGEITEIGMHPAAHPLQKEIEENKQKRFAQAKKAEMDEVAKKGWIDTFSEN